MSALNPKPLNRLKVLSSMRSSVSDTQDSLYVYDSHTGLRLLPESVLRGAVMLTFPSHL